jgi:SET domain-containing protein
MKIYPVCYDTLPEASPAIPSFHGYKLKHLKTGLERLAVVATQDIRAREELTIDYNPSNEPVPPSTYPRQLSCCRCGAQNCRGVTVMVGE